MFWNVLRENTREGKIRIKFNCCKAKFFGQTKKLFFFVPEKRLNLFFSIHYTCEEEPLLCERLEEQPQHEQTKESTAEKSGEREDGFEGRERRPFGVVFEDS